LSNYNIFITPLNPLLSFDKLRTGLKRGELIKKGKLIPLLKIRGGYRRGYEKLAISDLRLVNRKIKNQISNIKNFTLSEVEGQKSKIKN